MITANKKLSISIIGSGNVANTLAISLFHRGCEIKQIASRNIKTAKQLAKKVQAEAVSLKDFDQKVDAVVICVADDAIETVAQMIDSFPGIVMHTSGSVSINVLPQKNAAVLYPFVSMRKERVADLNKAQIFIEAKNKNTLRVVTLIANVLSEHVQRISSDQRLCLHLAAVFAHNFVNHQMTIAQEILKQNQLSFNILRPLIENYFLQLASSKPDLLQTGPAVRNDKNVIARHLKMLEKNSDFKQVYKSNTRSIQKLHLHD